MTNEFQPKPLALRDSEASLVIAESESFVAFEEWMDAQLETLVARWAHMAAPNASRVSRISRRGVR